MSRQKNKEISTRFDGMTHRATGRGTQADKLTGLSPSIGYSAPVEQRQWYLANGFISNIIDAPAEDATREWITGKTNRDQEFQIWRKILNRLTDIRLRERVKDLIRFSRMHDQGGFLFWGIRAEQPQTDIILEEAIPENLLRLDYVNVFGPEGVAVMQQYLDPLSRDFHRPIINVYGTEIHPSRLEWMVHSYLPEEQRGRSVLTTILDAIKAQDTALWSVTSLLFEMSVKVLTSSDVGNLSPDQIAKTSAQIRAVLSTQGLVPLKEGEKLERLAGTGQADTTLKQIFDFIFDNLAGLSQIPKARLTGQAQGVIAAGQFDLLAYYDSCAKFQEHEVRPIIEKAIKLVVYEREGEIYKLLNGDVASLDWEFEFNPLWKMTPSDQATIELQQAQRDQIYITTTVINPQEVRRLRFKDLEEFSKSTPPPGARPPVNLAKPPIAPPTPQKPAPSQAAQEGPQGGGSRTGPMTRNSKQTGQ